MQSKKIIGTLVRIKNIAMYPEHRGRLFLIIDHNVGCVDTDGRDDYVIVMTRLYPDIFTDAKLQGNDEWWHGRQCYNKFNEGKMCDCFDTFHVIE